MSRGIPEAGIVDINDNTNAHMVNASGLREPDFKYTLPEAMMTRDYLFMYITLAGNRWVSRVASFPSLPVFPSVCSLVGSLACCVRLPSDAIARACAEY